MGNFMGSYLKAHAAESYQARMKDEPKIVGFVPVSIAVNIVCLCQLTMSVLILNYIVIGKPLDVGVLVSPMVQWWYGVVAMVNLAALVMASVGALYTIETHVRWYSRVLIANFIFDCVLFVLFLTLGRHCKNNTYHSLNDYLDSIYCGLDDVDALLLLVFSLMFRLVALYVVEKCRKFIRDFNRNEFLPFVKDDLKKRHPSDYMAFLERYEKKYKMQLKQDIDDDLVSSLAQAADA